MSKSLQKILESTKDQELKEVLKNVYNIGYEEGKKEIAATKYISTLGGKENESR